MGVHLELLEAPDAARETAHEWGHPTGTQVGGLETDHVLLGEPLDLAGSGTILKLPLAVTNISIIYKVISLFYFSKCVWSLATRKVPADTSLSIIPETTSAWRPPWVEHGWGGG